MGDKEKFFKSLKEISKQFLCTFPLLNFNWMNILDSYLTETEQELLLNETVNSQILLEYPVNINYQKLFLKHIINKLEYIQVNSLQESTIHDEIYSAYARLVAEGAGSQENFKHYCLDNNNIITLKESNSLISDGTTGLRTWQASLALSEWIGHNTKYLSHKVILELGSGIGLTGIALQKLCDAKGVYLTDCHETVLDILCENMRLNIEGGLINPKDQTSLKERCFYSNEDKSIHAFNISWEDFSKDICIKLGKIDLVLGADIIYDKDLFTPLLNAIKCLKDFSNVEEFIFCCTERNPETLQHFLKLMRQVFQQIDQLNIPDQSMFVWPNDTPIKLYRFKD